MNEIEVNRRKKCMFDCPKRKFFAVLTLSLILWTTTFPKCSLGHLTHFVPAVTFPIMLKDMIGRLLKDLIIGGNKHQQPLFQNSAKWRKDCQANWSITPSWTRGSHYKAREGLVITCTNTGLHCPPLVILLTKSYLTYFTKPFTTLWT